MNYKKIDLNSYYRKGVFRHFSQDCKCSVSMTARLDVTELVSRSGRTGSRFYLDFLYLLCKVLNSREDYRMGYLWQTGELICYDVIHPTQYVFHEDTETCTPVYSKYDPDYRRFYDSALRDLEEAEQSREYGLDQENHPNWFDASYISWLSYDSLNIELPDGYLYFPPIVNWGRYREENGRLMMPVSVRLNHAIADGFLLANVFRLLQREIEIREDGFWPCLRRLSSSLCFPCAGSRCRTISPTTSRRMRRPNRAFLSWRRSSPPTAAPRSW